MASLAEAVMQGMIASMQPNAAMEHEALASYLKAQDKKVKVETAKAVQQIGQLLTDAIKAQAEPAVIIAYKKILEDLVA